MLYSCAIKHGALESLTRTSFARSQWLKIPLLRNTYVLDRHRSTYARTFATDRPAKRRDGYTYPEKLNIFDSGFVPMMVNNVTRILGTVLFGVGTLWAGSIPFDPATSNYWIPAYLISGAIPLIAHGLMIGGFVHHINILLPSSARRSKDALINFTHKLPGNTRLQMKIFWFRPWAHVKELELRDLRRLPASRLRLRLTNMEQQPINEEMAIRAKQYPFRHWLVMSFMGRFWVARDQMKDRSRVPGVWNTIWEQIPMVGEEPVANTKDPKNVIRRVKTSAQNSTSAVAAKRNKPPPSARAKP